MNPPDFTLDKIKFATDESTFDKAAVLYSKGKVTQITEGIRSYSGIVLGTKPYRVSVEARDFRYATCDCYLGKRDTLCKHMIALALYVVKDGKPLSDGEAKSISTPSCSGIARPISDEELAESKEQVAKAMRYIKPYNGPSRTWEASQNSLEEGCKRLSVIITELPVTQDMAKLLVDMLLRLDRKLQTGGVDDSNGIVGGFIQEAVTILLEFARLDPTCKKAFSKLATASTCFGWEEPLVQLIEN